MKAVYPVIFTKDKKGEYLVEVPDLDCLTEKILQDAIYALIGKKYLVNT